MHQLSVQRHFDAAPDRVWSAITISAEWAAWMWPASFATDCQVDLRITGRYHLGSPTAGIGVGGEYQVIEPPSRLVITWRWDGETEVTTVEIALDPRPNGTALTLVHGGFANEKTRDDHVQGWNDCLDRLATHLTTPDQTTTEGQTT